MVAGEGGVVIMIQVGLPVQQLVLLEEDFLVQMIGLVQCKHAETYGKQLSLLCKTMLWSCIILFGSFISCCTFD